MLDNLFSGLFDSESAAVISISDFLLCIGVALVIGIILIAAYAYKTKYTQSFITTLGLLPAVVCVVIMMVNGNVGTGVAVAGAFGLVRFRSAPGTAKEICAIFVAMGAGLIIGMGYIGYALLFAIVLAIAMIVYTEVGFSMESSQNMYKVLRITIPEDLDYTDVFDDLLKEYTDNYELVQVRTTNMGSMFKLTYQVTMKKGANEKEFIDKLRCRNGNLEINMSFQETINYEL